MATAIINRAGAGFPGDVIEKTNINIRTTKIDPNTNPPQAAGDPVKLVGEFIEAIQSGDTAADFYGILVRDVPVQGATISAGFGNPLPNAEFPQGTLINGYIAVTCAVGVPVVGQPVYLRILENLPNVVGQLEATSVPGENVLLPGVTWSTSGTDANLVTGIHVLAQ